MHFFPCQDPDSHLCSGPLQQSSRNAFTSSDLSCLSLIRSHIRRMAKPETKLNHSAKNTQNHIDLTRNVFGWNFVGQNAAHRRTQTAVLAKARPHSLSGPWIWFPVEPSMRLYMTVLKWCFGERCKHTAMRSVSRWVDFRERRRRSEKWCDGFLQRGEILPCSDFTNQQSRHIFQLVKESSCASLAAPIRGDSWVKKIRDIQVWTMYNGGLSDQTIHIYTTQCVETPWGGGGGATLHLVQLIKVVV